MKSSPYHHHQSYCTEPQMMGGHKKPSMKNVMARADKFCYLKVKAARFLEYTLENKVGLKRKSNTTVSYGIVTIVLPQKQQKL